VKRRLVIAPAERRRVEDVKPPIIAGDNDEVLVAVAKDDGGCVEVGAGGREPVLDLQGLRLERHHGARIDRGLRVTCHRSV